MNDISIKLSLSLGGDKNGKCYISVFENKVISLGFEHYIENEGSILKYFQMISCFTVKLSNMFWTLTLSPTSQSVWKLIITHRYISEVHFLFISMSKNNLTS